MYGAIMITAEGEPEPVELPADEAQQIGTLQALLGGHIEFIALGGGRFMVIDEDGKGKPHRINQTATAIAHEVEAISADDYIAGAAVILPPGLVP